MNSIDETAVTYKIESNTLSAGVCGAADEYLHLIENALDIKIYARGNVFSIEGNRERALLARDVLKELKDLVSVEIDLDPLKVEHVIQKVSSRSTLEKLSDTFFAKRFKMPRAGRYLEAKTPAQGEYIQKILSKDITFSVGPAGTGKTFLAVAIASMMLTEDKYERIVLTRPVVEAGESLGYLPGDFEQKISPYMRPLYDALHALIPYESIRRYTEEGRIEIAPLAYMRGRTLSSSFVILDEAQNTTISQMKMFLSRIGEDSRVVITGDITQVDLPKSIPSGLKHALSILRNIDEIAFHRFSRSDVVRHRLVGRILRAYEESGETTNV